MMNIPTLTTPRLTFRPFTEADAEPLHRILNEDGILRYFPRPEPPDLARVQRLVAGQLRHWEEHGLGWWAVELRSTGELLGWNGLQYLPDTEEVEVGYLLSRRHWGQGLATEGAQAALRFGVETLRLGQHRRHRPSREYRVAAGPGQGRPDLHQRGRLLRDACLPLCHDSRPARRVHPQHRSGQTGCWVHPGLFGQLVVLGAEPVAGCHAEGARKLAVLRRLFATRSRWAWRAW